MGCALCQTNVLLQVTQILALISEAYSIKPRRREAQFQKSSIKNPKLTTNDFDGLRKSNNL